MTATITPRLRRHPVPDADGLIFRDGYAPVHEVARTATGGSPAAYTCTGMTTASTSSST